MTGAFVRLFGPALALLALTGCGGDSGDAGNSDPALIADPILYEITSADGAIEGWMIGTIHALPDGTEWRTDAVRRVIREADYLLVEVAALADREAIAETFTILATTPGQPDLRRRVRPELRPALERAMRDGDKSPDDFASTETWAAALILARIAATGDPANGVDTELIGEFETREVREFEGALEQLRVFDSLAEEDQRDLLEGVLTEIEAMRQSPGRLRDAWLTGDEAALEHATRSGIMADREIYEALLLRRNERWSAMLADALDAREKPLVAVGAGHLVGPDSLGAMLAARGYSVRRLSR